MRVPLSRKIRAAADRLGKGVHPHAPNKKGAPRLLFYLVRKMGLEPTRHRHTHLKRACLPIPALPHNALSLYHLLRFCQDCFSSNSTKNSRFVFGEANHLFLAFLTEGKRNRFLSIALCDFFFMDLRLCSAKYCQRSPIFRFLHLVSNRSPVPYSHRP